MAAKVNRINRNFGIKVHLYFNSSSFNRTADSTPRFYLKPVELLSVEKVAFTRHAKNKDYKKFGNRFWKWKSDPTLTQDQITSIYEEIKNSHPYGYVEGDTASTNKYIFDVKENEAFQSFYKTYWQNNLDKIKQPTNTIHGLDYPHPYIEFNTNEIVTYKHIVGTVPSLPADELWGTYSDLYSEYYSEPERFSCNDQTLDVFYSRAANIFAVEGNTSNYLVIGTGIRYRFDLGSISGIWDWPTGIGGGYSGVKFKLSTGLGGTTEGFNEYTTNVSYIKSPELSNYYVKVGTKGTSQHPYYGQGSINGFILSGYDNSALADVPNWDEGAEITLRRESTYRFHQHDSTNATHPLYISTEASGAATGVNSYSSGVSHWRPIPYYDPGVTGDGYFPYVEFIVPQDAPDTLYYACQNHSYMGGKINIIDSPAAPSGCGIPGESLAVTFSEQPNLGKMYYYSPDLSGITYAGGGRISVRKDCDDLNSDIITRAEWSGFYND